MSAGVRGVKTACGYALQVGFHGSGLPLLCQEDAGEGFQAVYPKLLFQVGSVLPDRLVWFLSFHCLFFLCLLLSSLGCVSKGASLSLSLSLSIYIYIYIPQTAFGCRGCDGVAKGPWKVRRGRHAAPELKLLLIPINGDVTLKST